jgi:hypothetical protein
MRQLEAPLTLQQNQVFVAEESAHIAPNELGLSALGHQGLHFTGG